MQRAFDRSLQIADGRVLRIGAYALPDAPQKRCVQGYCRYCIGETCSPFDKTNDYACSEETAQKDCPQKWGNRKTIVSEVIEVFSPPSPVHPNGSLAYLRMKEGRSSTAAIQLQDGRVFITGGWARRRRLEPSLRNHLLSRSQNARIDRWTAHDHAPREITRWRFSMMGVS